MADDATEQDTTTVEEAGSATSQESRWFDSFDDDELKAAAEQAGWTSPQEAVKSYVNLRKLNKGSPNVLALPEDGDEQGWQEVFDKLGRPATADDYSFEAPEDAQIDGATVERLKKEAHEAGLTRAQWERLAKGYTEAQRDMLSRMADDHKISQQQEVEQWKKDNFKSDAEYELAVSRGKLAVQQLGLGDDMLDKLDQSMGSAAVLDLMTRVGRALGDDTLVQGNGGGTGAVSKASARVKLQNLQADKNFVDSLMNPSHPQHAANRDEYMRLQKIAFTPDEQ